MNKLFLVQLISYFFKHAVDIEKQIETKNDINKLRQIICQRGSDPRQRLF